MSLTPRPVQKLTRPGYSTRPSAEALAALPDSALAALSGFAVCRKNYGEIAWEGALARSLRASPVAHRQRRLRHAALALTPPAQAAWTCAAWTWTRWSSSAAQGCVGRATRRLPDLVLSSGRACLLQVDVYPRGCGLTPPVGCGLNRPAEVSLAERGVLAAAAREQPQAAQTGVVQLRLQRRSAAGQRRVWTYAVPLAGGQATLLATEGSDEDDLLEGSTAAHHAAPREDAMQLDAGAAACAERPAAAEAQAEAEEAQEAVALQLAPLRSSLDDVDD